MALYLLQNLREAMKDLFAEKNHTHDNLEQRIQSLEDRIVHKTSIKITQKNIYHSQNAGSIEISGYLFDDIAQENLGGQNIQMTLLYEEQSGLSGADVSIITTDSNGYFEYNLNANNIGSQIEHSNNPTYWLNAQYILIEFLGNAYYQSNFWFYDSYYNEYGENGTVYHNVDAYDWIEQNHGWN